MTIASGGFEGSFFDLAIKGLEVLNALFALRLQYLKLKVMSLKC